MDRHTVSNCVLIYIENNVMCNDVTDSIFVTSLEYDLCCYIVVATLRYFENYESHHYICQGVNCIEHLIQEVDVTLD